MFDAAGTSSNILLLESRLGRTWSSISKARVDTQVRRQHLEKLFLRGNSPDTSLVVFGSVAREEITLLSDLDWILLIDGQSVPEHKDQEREIERVLTVNGFIKPGKSGVFGKMVGSHDIVHNIGGEDDLNSNTTRRILLLLESFPIGNREAYDRVRRQIVRRYLEDDRGLTHASGDIRVPRFLLNDLVRYWRTVTVDFVYKQRAEHDEKWALRNAKLRMSRKLVFAAGLAIVFFCHLDPTAEEARKALKEERGLALLTAYLVRQFSFTPLETIAKVCSELKVTQGTLAGIFDNYDRFLAILDDRNKRDDLEMARTHHDLRKSEAWNEIRNVSKPFHDGLVALFLKEHERLTELTMTYGIF